MTLARAQDVVDSACSGFGTFGTLRPRCVTGVAGGDTRAIDPDKAWPAVPGMAPSIASGPGAAARGSSLGGLVEPVAVRMMKYQNDDERQKCQRGHQPERVRERG